MCTFKLTTNHWVVTRKVRFVSFSRYAANVKRRYVIYMTITTRDTAVLRTSTYDRFK